MKQSSPIESLSYGTIYITGCVVAALISLSQSAPVEKLVVYVACSWGYVIYWAINYR